MNPERSNPQSFNQKRKDCFFNPESPKYKGKRFQESKDHLANAATPSSANSNTPQEDSISNSEAGMSASEVLTLMTKLSQGKKVSFISGVAMVMPKVAHARTSFQPESLPSSFAPDNTWISLCDGMSCAALIAQALSISPSRFLSVEISAKARQIANCANPITPTFCGLDHSWHSNVNHITESCIQALGRHQVSMLLFGAPCEDFSKLRLLPPRHKGDKSTAKGDDPRPGLHGPKGQLFLKCIQILKWTQK